MYACLRNAGRDWKEHDSIKIEKEKCFSGIEVRR